MLSSKLNDLNDLDFTQEEMIKESAARAVKLSIQGVQPKLSAKLNIQENRFDIADRLGNFILKPQNLMYPELP